MIPDFDPNRQIAIIWSVEDVQQERPHLTDEQAMDVLEQVKRKHDATIGVNWDTLAIVADYLFPKDDNDDFDYSPLVCKKCGYKQYSFETIKVFKAYPHNEKVDNHDIAYFCGACQNNCSDEEREAMESLMNGKEAK